MKILLNTYQNLNLNCPNGETGRHAALKMLFSFESADSISASGTLLTSKNKNNMKQKITLVTATFGSVDATVDLNSSYENTIEFGRKRLCFDNIVPETMDIRKENFHIIIYDGVRPRVEIIINDSNMYIGHFDTLYPRTGEILCMKG